MTVIVCIHCAMKAHVEGKELPTPIEETVAEHMTRCHPGPYEDVVKERLELECRLAKEGLGDDLEGGAGQASRGRRAQ